MKIALPLLIYLVSTWAWAGECAKVEFAELKEYSDEQLVRKYCTDMKDHDGDAQMAEFFTMSASTSSKMGDIQGAGQAYEKATKRFDDAKACKIEMDRVVRILEQRKIAGENLAQKCQK